MARIGLVSKVATAVFAVGSLALAGCGGGGSGGGVPRPPDDFNLGTPPTVFKLQTPLGLAGSRGSGTNVFVALNLKDREFNPAFVQMEYGWDVNGVNGIEGSFGDPTTTDEFFPCTPAIGLGESLNGMDTAGGKAGADHLFVWDSATDVPGARFPTLDYDYTPQGRPKNGSDGLPLFLVTPGIKLRARANDAAGAPGRWGPWNTTVAFDLNNNNQPTVNIDETQGIFGVTPNASGAAADEDVILNLRFTDLDSDPMAVAVDWAQVPEGADLADPNVLASLLWFPATTTAGTPDTNLPSSPGAGTPATYSWDSVADAGTVNGRFILRATPFDAKSELGPTVLMDDGVAIAQSFRLDNYTIFTDPGTALSQPRIGHRATTLANDRVLVTGGRTSTGGASVNSAELFFPGIGETTLGAVAATAPMATARSFHSATRLFDDRVVVIGGFSSAGGVLNSIEVYDPSAGTWATLGGATLATARARHSAVTLPNGDVLVSGGVDGTGAALSSAEIFRVSNNTVTQVAEAMSAARHSVTGVLLPDGRILIPGGKNTAGGGLSSVEIYDPLDNGGAGGFVAAPSMSAARGDHSISQAPDGRVFVAGGTGLSSVEIFDSLSGTWSSAAAMNTARAGHVGVLTGDGRLLLAGGHNGATVIGTAQVYIPSSNSYDAPNGDMQTARRDAAVTTLNNGRVLIVGGQNAAGTALASIEVYSPDGGFNYGPTARIATPSEPQSWAFGALLSYRLIDRETNPARVLFQYSISGGPWQACTSAGGLTDDGVADTIAGDENDGVVSLRTTASDSTLPIDPYLVNTVGDHLFVWDISNDLGQNNYDAVKVRVIPFGAFRGVAATTTSFKIVRNTKVIPQFAGFTQPAHGNIRFDYHLRDIDASATPGQGDTARVVFEFGRDLNGDQQILTDDGESWTTCTAAPGGEAIGGFNNYPLVTNVNAPGAIGTTGWHVFVWDSVRDLGSPNPNEIWTDVIVRITPYDFPAGDAEETKGRQESLGNTQGFRIDIDPNGLFLVSWRVQGGTTYTAGNPIQGVRLDEQIIFTFSNEVDPTTVDGTVGRTTLPITVGGASPRQVLGTYLANPANYREVVFYPQLNNIVNGAAQYNGSENPTILTRNTDVRVFIPGYQPGSNPASANVLRLRFPGAGGTAVEIVNLPTLTFNPGFRTTAAAGTTAFYPNGSSPTYVTSTPTNGQANQALNQGISVTLDGQISAETFSPTAIKFRVDVDGDGFVDPNDSVIPGAISIANTAGPNGGAVITFTPMSGFNYPIGSSILVDFSGLRAGDGTMSDGGTNNLGRMSFGTTNTGTTTTYTFSEDFQSQTNNDTSVTNALWDSALFDGVLTGLRDGGDGSDGTPSANASGLTTFSAKSEYNFSSFNIGANQIWRFTGGGTNQPVVIRCTGDVNIAGVLDVSGEDANLGTGRGSQSTPYGTTSTNYGLRYSTTFASGATALPGGYGIAGGGAGGSSRHLTSGNSGSNGVGGSGAGTGGSQYSTQYAGGGGGGGHAQSGQNGGVYTTGYTGNGSGGSSYGASDMANGQEAGAGGGAGASYYTYYSYSDETAKGSGSYQTYYFYHPGGSGGGGGGAVKVLCNGAFTVTGSGIIDASGGVGANGYYFYAAGGGGGSGGSIWIVSGGAVNVGGMLDVRGGYGGNQFYYHPTSTTSNPTRYGCTGGHGSAGRIRIEGPNMTTKTQTNFIAGTHFNTVASVAGASTNPNSGSFPSGSTVNIDNIAKDSNGYMNFTTMSIPSGTTVTLTGSSPAKMRFTGNVSISGTLMAIGSAGGAGSSATQTAPNPTAGAGALGAGSGGLPNSSGTTSHSNALNGNGSGGGRGGLRSRGWTSGSYVYYYGGSGGGGARTLLNDRGMVVGTNTGQIPNAFNTMSAEGGFHVYLNWYYNAAIDGGAAGTGYVDPSAMTLSNLQGGSGGGGGANAGYNYNNGSTVYFYGGTPGGGGGGGIAIETASNFAMGSAGKIDVRGGNGGQYPGVYYAGSGGGGSGGNVLIRANSLSISAGATIDTIGGLGGECYSAPTSYHMGSNGGNGGLGGVRIESVSSQNFLNRGGMLGVTTSTGSISLSDYMSGDRGATFWKEETGGLAPNFSNSSITFAGNVQARLEGAHPHPVTGMRDNGNTGFQDLATTPLNAGFSDAVDGYRHWRLFFQLAVGSPPPTVDAISLDITTK